MIAWREKFVATGIHFLVTMTFAAIAAAIIFLVWYPVPFATMIGGTELFLLVVSCDLVLGPLVSLVIYSSRKSRRALIFDYSLVGIVQLAALIYGVHVLAAARPVYVAFYTDRLEVVAANEISDGELAAARSPAYASLPLTGPRLVGIAVQQSERQEALFESLQGNEEHMRPKFFVAYEAVLGKIRARAKTIEELEKAHPEGKSRVEAENRKLTIPASRVRWLPVHHRKGFWTALIDTDSGKPLAYINLDPY